MIERFKEYLVEKFRTIAPTQEAMEYRKQVLADLLDRAQELSIKGMTDDDAIFNSCIDSLGDFDATLKDFESKRAMQKKLAARGKTTVLATLVYAVIAVAVYLIVSFSVPHFWGVSWLILVGAIFLGIAVGCVFGIVKAVKRSRYSLVVMLATVILILAFVFSYLMALMVFAAPYSWFTFLVMVIAVLAVDTTLCFILPINKVIRVLLLLVAVIVTAVLAYVMLGVAGVLAWHPYWFIILLGVALDLAIILTSLVISGKMKKAEKLGEQYNKDYYTDWE